MASRKSATTAELAFDLHANQKIVWDSQARFKVVVAGRRWGKTTLAVYYLVLKALECQDPLEWVYYVAPTFQQAKDVVWTTLLSVAHPVIKSLRSNEGIVELVNGVRIGIKGSDRPDTMRGVGLYFCVIDEMADMKPSVWEEILRPALTKSKGHVVFIGTPKGRNHFWQLCEDHANDDDWEIFHFKTIDNPYLDPEEIEEARKTMSSQAYRQEYEASFESGGGDVFREEWLQYSDEPRWAEADDFMAVDLAGFAEIAKATTAKHKRLDETSIAIVKTSREGWWVREIQSGRWDVRETSLRILRAARVNNVRVIGIEKGALKNAIHPYLEEQMLRLNFFPRIVETTHGNKRKTDRIVWSLQGRLEHGRIWLNENDTSGWTRKFLDQYRNFPSNQVHDDMLDALSYIDQVSTVVFHDYEEPEAYVPLDPLTGY